MKSVKIKSLVKGLNAEFEEWFDVVSEVNNILILDTVDKLGKNTIINKQHVLEYK